MNKVIQEKPTQSHTMGFNMMLQGKNKQNDKFEALKGSELSSAGLEK